MRIFFLLCILFISTCCFAQQAKIVVTITGFKSDKGKVMMVLHNNSSAFPSKDNLAYRRVTATITNKTATVVFDNVPYGTYAIAVFHDENDNNKLDFNMVGYPAEKFGFSKNAKVVFSAPKWDEAKFSVQTSEVSENITLQ